MLSAIRNAAGCGRRVHLRGWLSICTILGMIYPANAIPISVGGPYLFVDDVGANDLNFATGKLIGIGALPVVPNGSAGTTATAQTTDRSTGLPTSPIVLPFAGSTASPDEFRKNISYNANLTGPWTLTFTNGANTTTVLTPSIVGVASAPFANNVTVSGSGLNPTFTWSYPTSVNGVTVLIYDKLLSAANGVADLVYANSVAGSTNSFTLPTALDGGLSLTPGTPYVVALKGLILRNPAGALSNPNTAAQSVAYFDFTPTTSGVPLNLPTVGPHGVYTYSMTVSAGTEYFIDPSIVAGYAYQIGAGDPNFASVQLPDIQTNDYDLSYLVGGSLVNALVAPGATFDFPSGGVSGFDVTGIDPSLMLDPGNTTAFVTGVTFTADGTFTGTQTPITTNVPEPGTGALLVSGIACLVLYLRRSGASASVTVE